MALVFQYGSNTSSLRINSAARLGGMARRISLVRTVLDHELGFRVWSPRNGCAAADLVSVWREPAPGHGRKIWGVLYDIPDAHVFRARCTPGTTCLDAVEGEGRNYLRIPVRIAFPDGSPVEREVLTYIARNPVERHPTSRAYVRHILDGLAEHEAPAEYIRYVRERIAESLAR